MWRWNAPSVIRGPLTPSLSLGIRGGAVVELGSNGAAEFDVTRPWFRRNDIPCR